MRKAINTPLMAAFRKALNGRVRLVRDDSADNGKPTVYVAAHLFYNDIPATLPCLRHSAYILHGQAWEVKQTSRVDYWGLLLNGIISMRRDSAMDRAQVKIDMARVLSNGGNVIAYCEGTWNFSPNALVLPMRWGILDAVKLAGIAVNIVPVACDLVDDDYCVVIGGNIEWDPSAKGDRQAFVQELRDKLATLVWDLYEMKQRVHRRDLPEPADVYWLGYIKDRCAEIAVRNQHKEDAYVYRPSGEISLDELLAQMHGIEYRSMAADYETYTRVLRLYEQWVSHPIGAGYLRRKQKTEFDPIGKATGYAGDLR